jgi:hypothetical protein
MTVLTDAQLDVWREREVERRKDAADIEFNRKRDERRREVSQEMLAFLDDFLDSRIPLQQFKDTFDRKTRTEWDVFGLKGMSGAMFLNTLVKHIPNQQGVAAELRRVLPVPENLVEGRAGMQAFYDYLMDLIHQGSVTRRQVQPSRATFFVSSWWHIQSPEMWPPHYISAQRALTTDNLIVGSGDPVADYFSFRDVFLWLIDELTLPAWEVEHLLGWYDERPSSGPIPDKPEPAPLAPEETPAEGRAHTHIQSLLARLGRKFGCKVWIAANDHNARWNGERLGDFSLSALPYLGLGAESQRITNLIDVIWIGDRNKVIAAFEIESTTSVYSGILRMSDLMADMPNLTFPLYLVIPAERTEKVQRELRRPTFEVLGLQEQCSFITFEDLIRESDVMLRWADRPSAIAKLAHKVTAE